MRYAMTPAARREAQLRQMKPEAIRATGKGGYIQLSDVVSGTQRQATVRVTGLAKVIAKDNNVALREITPSIGGRITKADVLAHISVQRRGKSIPHTEMRKVIARRMVSSMTEIPQYSLFAEYDANQLTTFMLAYAQEMKEAGDIKPTYTDFLVKIAAMALSKNEWLNSTFFDDRVQIHPHINIGIAVALENGLIVPNIKDADKKTLKDITRERRALVDKARSGRLLPDDYTGGTFTITNLGQYPVMFSTPIINQPESAILGIGALTDKVVPIDGGIGIRKMLGFSLTCDHRHIDGAKGSQFLADIKTLLEEPNKLL